ncbi:MAG: alkylhydroperoxidase-related (seleno)protein [Ilumatobacteraceae bacterium]
MVGIDAVAALHHRLLAELASPGDWWDAAGRQALMEEARAARGCARCADGRRHDSTSVLPVAAVEVVHRMVNEPGRLTRSWANGQIDALGDARYAEIVGVTAIIVAIDVGARAVGDPPPALAVPLDGAPARQRPGDVGPVGAWIPMTEEKLLANVTRALSLVPRTNGTWRTLVTESYSRGPEMLSLTWERALTRPQTELIAAHVSRMQECFY